MSLLRSVGILRTAMVWGCSLSLAVAAQGQRTGDVPYSEATFEVSTDPTKVVMQIMTGGSMLGISRSFTVYGDGLVEMQERTKGTLTEEHVTAIGVDGVQRLMEIAVSHGVPEWDSDTIRAWMRQKHPTLLNIADGGRVRVSLALEPYQRGAYEKSRHSASFSTKTPGEAAKFYPEIRQFQGVTELMNWFSAEWEKASQSSE